MSDENSTFILDTLVEQLKSETPKERLSAAKELGNFGKPEAIIELSKHYEQEDNAKVKKAIGEAIKKLAIIDTGKSAGLGGILKPLAALMVVSLLILVVANIGLRLGGSSDTPEETEIAQAEPSDLMTLLEGYQNTVAIPALANLNALRQEWTAAQETGQLPCSAELAPLPETVEASEIDRQTYPDLILVDDLQSTLNEFQLVTTTWRDSCDQGEPVDPALAEGALQILSDAETNLNAVIDQLATAQSNPSATNTPNIPTDEPNQAEAPTEALPSPTPEPTVEVRPTLDPSIVRGIERIISNTQSNMNSLLLQYWQPVEAGETSPLGCNIPFSIDEDYPAPPTEIIAAQPQLEAIVAATNVGLDAARRSADAYETNCLNNSFTPEIIAQGIADAQDALTNTELAQTELNNIAQ